MTQGMRGFHPARRDWRERLAALRTGDERELPAALKWESVAWAVGQMRDGLDWSLLDVRWDEPVLHQRGVGPQLAGE